MSRVNNFDGLRLIAALLVLWSHMFALSGRGEPRFFGNHSFGNLGVLIFFSISGFLISASWKSDPAIPRFLAKRFLRMVPALSVSIPLTYIAVLSLDSLGFPNNPLHPLNGSLWTLPFEVICYLLFMGMALLTSIPALVFAGAMLAAHYFLPPSFLSYFGLFFAAGALLRTYPRFRSVPSLLLLAMAALILRHDSILALALIVPAVTIYTGTRSWPLLRSAGRYGDLSYGIYIYAWPTQQLIVAALGRDAPYFALFSLSLSITLVLAWLSWHYVEAPALRRKPLSQNFANEAARDLSTARDG